MNFFCDPKTHEPLIERQGNWVSEDGSACYPIADGIACFLKEGDVTGNNKKYQELYDKIGRFTGSVFWFVCKVFRLDLVSKRKDLLSDLAINPGDRVLETSIGAGANIPALDPRARYVGVDISMGMLRACQKYALAKPYCLELIHANAEELPLKDDSFDVVFHFGGINFFNDIPRAIREMIRVAKPGALIWIGDETQKHIDGWYKRIPVVRRYFQGVRSVGIPLEHIPEGVVDLQVKYKWDRSMYVLVFRKGAQKDPESL